MYDASVEGWRWKCDVTVPRRSQRRTVVRKAFEAIAKGTTVTEAELMVVPWDLAQPVKVRTESEPRLVIG